VSEIYEWNPVDGLNIDAGKSGTPEGMARSDVNNRAREHLGALRRWYDAPEWLDLMKDTSGDPLVISKVSANVIRAAGRDMTAYFPATRRVRMTGGTPATVYAHVVSVVFSGGDTDVTLDSFSGHTEVPPGVSGIDLHHSSSLGKNAFSSTTSTGFFTPASADAEGINDAIDAAVAAGGGIVLLKDASYAVDAKITIKADVCLWGAAGRVADLVVDAALADVAITMQSRSSLVGGNIDASAQTGSHHAIEIAANQTEISIEGTRILEAQDSGIYVHGQAATGIRIQNCRIIDPGEHGIFVDAAVSSGDDYLIDSIYVEDPGANSVGDVAGVYFFGVGTISNVHVTCDRAAPIKQRGVWMGSKSAAGLYAGQFSSISNVTVRGTGGSAIGVELSGEYCTLHGLTSQLSGVTSRGVVVDSHGAGQVADYNVIMGCVVDGAGIAYQFAPDAYYNELIGCIATASQLLDVEVNGFNNSIRNCHFADSLGDSIEVTTSAVDTVITDNRIEQATNGVDVKAGATRTRIARNTFVGGTYVADAGTDTMHHRVKVALCTADTSTGGGPAAITGLAGITFPYPPDGSRRFHVIACFDAHVFTAAAGQVNLHFGTNGTVADPIIGRRTSIGTVVNFLDVTMQHILTPTTGQKLTMSIEHDGGGTTTGYQQSTSRFGCSLSIHCVDEEL
jgi:hypothetical protein